MNKQVLIGLTLLVIVSFIAGAWWNGRGDHEWRNNELDRLAVEREKAKTQLQVEMGQKWALLKLGVGIGAGVILLAALAGLSIGAVRLLNHRVGTLYPNDSGLYPVRQLRMGRRTVFHDPNRVVGPIIIYTADEVETIMSGDAEAQQMVTTQAQVVQALAASSQNAAPDAAQKLLSARNSPKRRYLPPIETIEATDYSLSHVEKLLIESGEMEA